MALKVLPDPAIKIMKAHCSAFQSGFCYSANNPFYSGHYETPREALKAAKKTAAPASPVSVRMGALRHDPPL